MSITYNKEDELINDLNSTDWSVRWNAIRELGKLKSEKSVKYIAKFLKVHDPDIKNASHEALRNIATKEAIDLLSSNTKIFIHKQINIILDESRSFNDRAYALDLLSNENYSGFNSLLLSLLNTKDYKILNKALKCYLKIATKDQIRKSSKVIKDIKKSLKNAQKSLENEKRSNTKGSKRINIMSMFQNQENIFVSESVTNGYGKCQTSIKKIPKIIDKFGDVYKEEGIDWEACVIDLNKYLKAVCPACHFRTCGEDLLSMWSARNFGRNAFQLTVDPNHPGPMTAYFSGKCANIYCTSRYVNLIFSHKKKRKKQ